MVVDPRACACWGVGCHPRLCLKIVSCCVLSAIRVQQDQCQVPRAGKGSRRDRRGKIVSASVQCDGGSRRVDRHGVAWAVVCPRRCQMLKGMMTASFCPALSLYLTRHNMSYAYCGVEPHGWGHLVMTFFVIWLGTDLWEWAYHYLGHVTTWGWSNHKYHHLFFNPSPFAVIAGA